MDSLARLGEKRQLILEHLEERGGVCTVDKLMASFAGKRSRPRDFERRTLAMLAGWHYDDEQRRWHRTGPAVVVLEGDVVSLAGRWREALEDARQIAGEIDHEIGGRHEKGADTLQREKHVREREAFRRRNEVEAILSRRCAR